MRALIHIGPPAENEVRKYLSHEEARARTNAQRVLKLIGKTDKDDAYNAALGAITSGNTFGILDGLRWFEKNDPTPATQPGAAKALAALLSNNNAIIVGNAATALSKWATRAELPVLLDYLDKNQQTLGNLQPILEALARLHDARAIPMLIKLIEHPTQHPEVAKALIAIGPPEQTMIAVLKDGHGRANAKCAACKVLEHHGTAYSLEALRRVRAEAAKVMYAGWRDVEQSARSAIEAIEKRR
jgi:HEAT repeat protein